MVESIIGISCLICLFFSLFYLIFFYPNSSMALIEDSDRDVSHFVQ